MTNEFKVLEWLRGVRDRNAESEEGFSIEEAVAHTEERAKDLLEEVLENPDCVLVAPGDWRERQTRRNSRPTE